MATPTKPCTTPLDLAGTGSIFDNIPFSSKHHVYRMPKELPLPLSLLDASAISPVTSPANTPRVPTPSGNPVSDTCKQSLGKRTEHESSRVEEKVMVFGVELGGYLEVSRDESVFDRFMREESLVERLWGNGWEGKEEVVGL